MKTPEDAVNDAVVNPPARLMILLVGTWLIGSLHPIPETIYYLIRGPVRTGAHSSWEHVPQWLDFYFLPVLGGMVSKTALVSGPVSVFCIVCSALDRWNWKKVTVLSGISTFSMLMLDDWTHYDKTWVTLTMMHLAIMIGVTTIIPSLRRT